MVPADRVKFARQSFAENRRIVEQRLALRRKEARIWLDVRHHRTDTDLITRLVLRFYYVHFKKPYLVPEMREYHWKIHFYRKVESDLARGDLSSAIEALSLFVPKEEAPAEVANRVMRSPATIASVLRSPSVLRSNMLRLRDELIRIQQTKTG